MTSRFVAYRLARIGVNNTCNCSSHSCRILSVVHTISVWFFPSALIPFAAECCRSECNMSGCTRVNTGFNILPSYSTLLSRDLEFAGYTFSWLRPYLTCVVCEGLSCWRASQPCAFSEGHFIIVCHLGSIHLMLV